MGELGDLVEVFSTPESNASGSRIIDQEHGEGAMEHEHAVGKGFAIGAHVATGAGAPPGVEGCQVST